MTWFKVDDSFSDHPKVRRIPRRQRPAAIGLWTLAGSWSARHLTDGTIPDYMVDEFGCTAKEAGALVNAGLWVTTDDGYRFHDWMAWQPSKEKVETEREAAAERQRRARQRAKEAREQRERQRDEAEQASRHHDEVTDMSHRDESVSHDPVMSPRPDPTRPVLPTEVKGLADTTADAVASDPPTTTDPKPKNPRGTRLRKGWMPTTESIETIRKKFPHLTSEQIDDEHGNFERYWLSKAGRDATKLDWDATWINWMNRADWPAILRRAGVEQRTTRDDATARLRAQYREWEATYGVPVFDGDTEADVKARAEQRGVA